MKQSSWLKRRSASSSKTSASPSAFSSSSSPFDDDNGHHDHEAESWYDTEYTDTELIKPPCQRTTAAVPVAASAWSGSIGHRFHLPKKYNKSNSSSKPSYNDDYSTSSLTADETITTSQSSHYSVASSTVSFLRNKRVASVHHQYTFNNHGEDEDNYNDDDDDTDDEEIPTKVVCGMSYTCPTTRRNGFYTGQVTTTASYNEYNENVGYVPHGMGTLRLPHGRLMEGEWHFGELLFFKANRYRGGRKDDKCSLYSEHSFTATATTPAGAFTTKKFDEKEWNRSESQSFEDQLSMMSLISDAGSRGCIPIEQIPSQQKRQRKTVKFDMEEELRNSLQGEDSDTTTTTTGYEDGSNGREANNDKKKKRSDKYRRRFSESKDGIADSEYGYECNRSDSVDGDDCGRRCQDPPGRIHL